MHSLIGQKPIFYCTSKHTWKAVLQITCLMAHDLQTFLMFSQHPAWFVALEKPIERAVYCLTSQLYGL